MSSLKNIKLRIVGVNSTQKITKAMQLIAAARLKQANVKVKASKLYLDSLQNLLLYSMSSVDINNFQECYPASMEALYNRVNTQDHLNIKQMQTRHLTILITGESGLCGSYNSQIIQYALKHSSKSISPLFLCIGNKGYEYLNRTSKQTEYLHQKFASTTPKKLEFENNYSTLFADIMKLAQEYNVTSCDLIYSNYITALEQKPISTPLFPLKNILDELNQSPSASSNQDNTIHGTADEYLLTDLILQYIKAKLFHILLKAKQSEYAASMLAMDSATRNADSMLSNLSAEYNSNRQSIITRELIEIISGSEAMRN